MTDMDPEVYAARVWHFSVRKICNELDHGCGLTPARRCVPCLLDPGHAGAHDGVNSLDPGNDAILAGYRAAGSPEPSA